MGIRGWEERRGRQRTVATKDTKGTKEERGMKKRKKNNSSDAAPRPITGAYGRILDGITVVDDDAVTPDEKTYARTVAEKYSDRCGGSAFLSPVDVCVVADWETSGVPLKHAVRGIEQAASSLPHGERLRSIRYCEDAVLRGGKGQPVFCALAPAADADLRKRFRERLPIFVADVKAWKAEHTDAPPEIVECLRDIYRDLNALATDDAEEIAAAVSAANERLSAVVAALAGPQADAARAQAKRSLAPHKARMDAEVFAASVRAVALKILAERLDLDRLNLYSLILQ